MLKSLLNRLNNKGTILAISALVLSLIVQFGIDIDSDRIMGIITTICTILVSLGILNNPVDNTKAYVPYVSDVLVDKKKETITDELENNSMEDDVKTIEDNIGKM